MPENFKVGDHVHSPNDVYGTVTYVSRGFIGILGLDGENYKVVNFNRLKHVSKEEFASAEVCNA